MAVFFALTGAGVCVRAAETLPRELEGVGVQEHLGAAVDLNLTFTNSDGTPVPLRALFRDHKPVLLTLNYYECPMLCGLQLKALVTALRALDWTIGDEFRIVTVSINPNEGPALAAAKRRSVLESYDRGNVDWSFLTSDEPSVHKLAAQVGFGYRYDVEQKQYAHPTVLFALTPDGHIARYLYGLEFRPSDLKFSLMEASQGRTASTIDKVLLSCFHYDASVGRYAPYAMGIMRLAGVVTVLIVGAMLILFWRRERTRPTE